MATAVETPVELTELTDRQREILDFMKKYTADEGYPPSVREIGACLGINSPNGVMCHLRALERKGWIRRKQNQSRAIKFLN